MNIYNLWQQAELALASYGMLPIGTALPTSLTGDDFGMAVSQAANFSERWNVHAQFNDSASGASATVFQARDALGNPVGQKYLAIRGTEASGSDVAADGILALGIPSGLNPPAKGVRDI